MRRKGLSIFQKLFVAFFCVALITLIISGVVHYKSKKEFIERTITSQISDNLHASFDYFNKMFTIPIKKDLGFIEASPTLNNLLTSQKDEALLTKPPAERLFLYFTGTADSIYLSSRFIDSKGKEKIITAGKRRVRDYATIDHFPNNVLYRRIYSLFKRLKAENLGSILFEGPFKYKNKLTFVVGISKIEPEIGGFGGVVLFHCDLTGYLHYLSDIKFNQIPIAFVISPDNHVMLSPEKEASPDPGLYLSQEKNTNNALAVSSSVKLGSNNNVLLNLALSIPRKIFFSELKKALIDSALIGMSIILLVGFVAFFISMRLFAKPIKKLSYGTERIGRGDLNYRIKIETHDEIAQLADEFNRMAESLQKITVSRDMLVHEVNERKRTEEALKESEEKYRTQFEEALDAIFIADSETGVLIDCNYAALKLVGREKSEIVGKHQRILHPPEEVEGKFSSTFKHHLKEKEGQALEAQVITKNGEIRDVSIKANIFEFSGKKILQGIFRDVTELKQAEEEKKKFEATIQRAEKMEAIGTLAGGIAHDLNNILSGIASYPELLLMDIPEDSHLRKPLGIIQKSGQRAAEIVQDMLTLARRGVANSKLVNINDIVTEYLKSPEYDKLKSFHSEVEMEANLETDLLNIKGSSVHLSKSVMNLVSNAAEAMLDGGAIFISSKNQYVDRPIGTYDTVEEGDYVTLTVSDTGKGIASEDIKKIFEPFYTKKVMGRSGTGLGMAVVWGTVKDHKGYIDVQSAEGEGTTFTLYFPATREISTGDKSFLSIEQYKGNGESILVVDDVEEQRVIASGMLKKLGYSVTTVSSGEEAVSYMKDNSSDLLILDMIMDPGIDGLDTYKRILEKNPEQKVIIASGFSETERVKEAQRLGAGSYVKKPYVLEKIGLTVKEELEK